MSKPIALRVPDPMRVSADRIPDGTRVRFAASCTDVDCPSREGTVVAYMTPSTRTPEVQWQEYEVEYSDGVQTTQGVFWRSELEIIKEKS